MDPKIPLLDQIDELKEDLIQVECGNFILDVGWYPEFDENGQFRIVIIKDNIWDNPIIEKRCRKLSQLDENIKECIKYIQKNIMNNQKIIVDSTKLNGVEEFPFERREI